MSNAMTGEIPGDGPLTAAEVAALGAAVDTIIPPEDESPGGVEAGALEYFLRNLAPGGYFPGLLSEYKTGLAALDSVASETQGALLADLDPAKRTAVLDAFSRQDSRFFSRLVEQAQEGFYTSPAGLAMVGWKVTG